MKEVLCSDCNLNPRRTYDVRCGECYRAYRREYMKGEAGRRYTAKRNLHPTMKFIRLKYQARKRGIPVEISKEEYIQLLSRECHYCGGKIEDTGWGVDRKDNARGYTLENLVPSCKWCNTVKNDRYSYEEMKQLGQVIGQIHKARKAA